MDKNQCLHTVFLNSRHSSGVSVSALAMRGIMLTLSWSRFINSTSRGFNLKTDNKHMYITIISTCTVTCNKYSDKFLFCYIFHTKPYFFKAPQFCHFWFDLHEINSKQGRITCRFVVYWLIIFSLSKCFFSNVAYASKWVYYIIQLK